MLDFRVLLHRLANDIKEEILNRMASPIGVNPRLGENTLLNGDIYKSVDVYPKDENTIVFEIADYYEYIVKGWKHTHRLPRYVSSVLYQYPEMGKEERHTH